MISTTEGQILASHWKIDYCVLHGHTQTSREKVFNWHTDMKKKICKVVIFTCFKGNLALTLEETQVFGTISFILCFIYFFVLSSVRLA